jgi:hypothetical protein
MLIIIEEASRRNPHMVISAGAKDAQYQSLGFRVVDMEGTDIAEETSKDNE